MGQLWLIFTPVWTSYSPYVQIMLPLGRAECIMSAYRSLSQGGAECIMSAYGSLSQGGAECIMSAYRSLSQGGAECIMSAYGSLSQGGAECIMSAYRSLSLTDILIHLFVISKEINGYQRSTNERISIGMKACKVTKHGYIGATCYPPHLA